jgi:hypothetical protein
MTDKISIQGTRNPELDSKYEDPGNASEILERLKRVRTMKEVLGLASETFPDWFVTCLPGFSPDYPHITKNWHDLCTKMGVAPAQVMIVEYVSLGDPKNSLVAHFGECFTRSGFAVRAKTEYVPCSESGYAVPSFNAWKTMKDMGISVPETGAPNWSGSGKEVSKDKDEANQETST